MCHCNCCIELQYMCLLYFYPFVPYVTTSPSHLSNYFSLSKNRLTIPLLIQLALFHYLSLLSISLPLTRNSLFRNTFSHYVSPIYIYIYINTYNSFLNFDSWYLFGCIIVLSYFLLIDDKSSTKDYCLWKIYKQLSITKLYIRILMHPNKQIQSHLSLKFNLFYFFFFILLI